MTFYSVKQPIDYKNPPEKNDSKFYYKFHSKIPSKFHTKFHSAPLQHSTPRLHPTNYTMPIKGYHLGKDLLKGTYQSSKLTDHERIYLRFRCRIGLKFNLLVVFFLFFLFFLFFFWGGGFIMCQISTQFLIWRRYLRYHSSD